MIEYLSSDPERANIVEDVKLSNCLRALADHYITFLVDQTLANRGRTPPASPHPVTTIVYEDMNTATNELTSQRRTEPFRKSLLLRDQFHYVISSVFDIGAYVVMATAERKTLRKPDGITDEDTTVKQAAHAMPFGLASFDRVLPSSR